MNTRLSDLPRVDFELFGFLALIWIIADLANSLGALDRQYLAAAEKANVPAFLLPR